MERLFTIGVYGFEAERFFQDMQGAEIDLFLDIRRRRGVRGAEYAFANAGRLQRELQDRAIAYRHVIELTPENSTRALQARADETSHTARRARSTLSEAYVEDYTQRTLDPYDWTPLLADLESYRRPVLFCVERTSEACHRGLVAERLHELTGVSVTDLVP
jgi:uncharacterized protein (DUF488 family)